MHPASLISQPIFFHSFYLILLVFSRASQFEWNLSWMDYPQLYLRVFFALILPRPASKGYVSLVFLLTPIIIPI
ncbi:hypothetical protein B0H13DRAFT_1961227 [Mycena leptocephala]|nr:hypothetical protein B0H13DRAFT_1961227 [Mycena leptocephala]